jgi:beta-glucosidase
MFPGVRNAAGQPEVTYKEGLNFGYRWYDANKVTPAFPFGHGLSYTTFALSNLSVTPKVSDGRQPITVRFSVENTGPVAGAEVPQLYVQLPAAVGEPPKRLIGFEKVWLNPGERRQVALTVNPGASNHPLGIFDTAQQKWATTQGAYVLYVGTSSRQIKLSDLIKITATTTN